MDIDFGYLPEDDSSPALYLYNYKLISNYSSHQSFVIEAKRFASVELNRSISNFQRF